MPSEASAAASGGLAAFFGSATAKPMPVAGGPPAVDLALQRRKSVLDVIQQDAADLNRVLGARDRARLEQHLEGIRSIEMRLTTTSTTLGNPAACSSPTAPTGLVGGKGEYDATMIAVNKAMADLVAMAFVLAVPLTVARAVGHTNMASYGSGKSLVTDSLTAVLT